ncbi:hypothetical protein BC940DRAFT_363547 [Gongronella butleri]|nr:hypothetical protein BC940DRAFT_363547 [Gongronella butleri]
MRVKNNENVLTANDFRGMTLPQRHGSLSVPVVSFKVFHHGDDDDPMEEEDDDDEKRKWCKVDEYIMNVVSKVNNSDDVETISTTSKAFCFAGNHDVISVDDI